MTSSSKTPQQKKIGQKPTTKMNTKTEKHRLAFNESGFNDETLKIHSIRRELEQLILLLMEAGVKKIDVKELLRDPFKTILPHMPKDFQTFAQNLTGHEHLNWDRFPGFRDILQWAKKNSTNVNLVNYQSYYTLNGHAKVDEVKIEQLKEGLTTYTETEKQAEYFSKASEAFRLFNDLQKIAPWAPPFSSRADMAMPFDLSSDQLVMSERFIAHILNIK